MQRRKRSEKTSKQPAWKVQPKTKAPRKSRDKKDLVMNIIILILSIAVIYLTYSLINRIFYKPIEVTSVDTGEPIRVEVLNGCGVSGLAAKMTDYLRDQGFDVVKTDNAENDNFEEMIIQDRSGNMGNAEKVANALNVPTDNIIQQINEDLYLDVTIIIGKNYQLFKPFNEE